MSGPTRTDLERLGASFEPAGFFVLRAPLLPMRAFYEGDAPTSLAQARARLRRDLDRPDVREAIAVASPSLAGRVDAWMREPEAEGADKVEGALMRYLSRMATRPTPFGLFAGCVTGSVGERTEVTVAGSRSHERHTRLDNGYLDRLAAELLADPVVRAGLRFRPNSSAYPLGGQVRFAEARRGEYGRTYDLVAVDDDEVLRRVFDTARDGATRAEIAAALCADDPEVALDEALAFVDELIDAQVLESSLEPLVTGPEPLDDLIASLRATGAAAPTRVLEDVRTRLRSIDEGPLGPRSADYAAIVSSLTELGPEVDEARLFQVDMKLRVERATLGGEALPDLVRAALVLARFTPQSSAHAMERFGREFERRYERQEVPLLEALDEDCGIGFDKMRESGHDPEPLLRDIAFGAPPEGGVGGWTAFEEMLRRKLERLSPQERVLRLQPEDFDGLAPRDATLPDSFALNVTFAAKSAEALDRGEHEVHLRTVEGPSGMNWLGRFCHGDPELLAHVRGAIAVEEALRPDVVFAEVVHLPEGRLGNVLVRPCLRRWEIPFLGRSGAPPEQQLPLDDLVVCVWDGRVVLKSKRLGREVVPRLTTAHGFTHPRNAGAYRFLCAMQTAGFPIRYGWTWGALEPHATFMPRVTFGRVVLSLARWTVKADYLRPLAEARTRAQRHAAVQALRARLELPRFVTLADGDNALPIDFEHALSVDSFVHLVRRRPVALLTETFPAPDEAWVQGPTGQFNHEMVIPFARRPDTVVHERPAPAWVHTNPEPPVQRLFPPGSPWLYLKLYASPRSCDVALARLAPVLERLRAEGLCSRWFFLRFADRDGWHLRLRLQGEGSSLLAEAMPRLTKVTDELLAQRLAWSVQLDTYHREVEHWGGPLASTIAEEILCIDSAAACDIVRHLHDRPAALADARWRLALLGTDGIWDAMGLDVAARHEVATGVRDGLGREFGLGPMLERQLSTRFRGERAAIAALLAPDGVPGPWDPWRDRFRRRDDAMRSRFDRLRALEREGRLNRPLVELAHRFSHLHANRMLRSMPREQELVLVDFLRRHYASAIGRARKAGRKRAG